MWRRKLGICADLESVLTVPEQIRLFADTGFEAFFTCWHRDEDLDGIAGAARESDMIWQSIHAPFGHADDMWREDESLARKGVQDMIACLRDCARNEVPLMIAHAYIGFEDFAPITELGASRYAAVVREAERLGVRIAFENTEGEDYLAYLLDYFRGNPTVGFCWDSGHEMCYNGSRDLLAKYGERILGTHLNDNLGVRDYNGRITWHDDLHLLPYDGIADWAYNMDRLAKTGFDDILTFEVNIGSKPNRHENDVYMQMPVRQYAAEAYKRACRVAAEFERQRAAIR